MGRGGRGGARLHWPLRPWRRIFASDAVVTPHLRFGTGSGAASPFLTLPWLPTSAPYRLATAGSDHARPWRRPVAGAHLVARVHFLSPVVHFAHTRDAPSTAHGDFPHRGYRPWPGKPSRRACMSTVPGRDASPGRNPQPGAHTIAAISGRKAPEPFGIAELNLNKILTRPGHLLFLSDY